MNLVIQIIERNANDQTITVRYTTDKVGASALDPQMENGSPKLRADGLIARAAAGDLCILPGDAADAKLQTLLTKHAPLAALHAAEMRVDPASTLSIDSVTVLAEQSINLP